MFYFLFFLLVIAIPSSLCFKWFSNGHSGITREALESIGVCSKHISSISKHNYQTDFNLKAEVHCDAEKIEECSNRLKHFQTDLGSRLSALEFWHILDKERFLVLLGNALHTLQDFYSHSNWIELGNTLPHPKLGIETVNPRPPSFSPCVVDQPDVLTSNPNGYLTSGYFELFTFECGVGPVGTCDHGKGSCPGINKDTVESGGAQYHEAFRIAVDATKEFVERIISTAGYDSYGVEWFTECKEEGGQFNACVDDTGSMGDEISYVRNWLENRATSLHFSSFNLVTFNDPGIDSFSTNNLDNYVAEIRSITVSGGGDCPEYAYTGLIRSAELAVEGSSIFFFSDADPKDIDREEELKSLLNEKKIKVFFILTNTCGFKRTTSSGYDELVDGIDGRIYHVAASEIEQVLTVLEVEVDIEFVLMSYVQLELEYSDTDSNCRAVGMNVDGSGSEISFLVNSDELQIFDVNGTDIEILPGVVKNVIDDIVEYRLSEYNPGIFTAFICATEENSGNTVEIKASALHPLELKSVTFHRYLFANHDFELSEIEQDVPENKYVSVRIILEDNDGGEIPSALSIKLVSANNRSNTLTTVSITESYSLGNNSVEYEGLTQIPTESFQVVYQTIVSGVPIFRSYPKIFFPSKISIEPHYVSTTISQFRSGEAFFSVIGESSHLTLSATAIDSSVVTISSLNTTEITGDPSIDTDVVVSFQTNSIDCEENDHLITTLNLYAQDDFRIYSGSIKIAIVCSDFSANRPSYLPSDLKAPDLTPDIPPTSFITYMGEALVDVDVLAKVYGVVIWEDRNLRKVHSWFVIREGVVTESPTLSPGSYSFEILLPPQTKVLIKCTSTDFEMPIQVYSRWVDITQTDGGEIIYCSFFVSPV